MHIPLIYQLKYTMTCKNIHMLNLKNLYFFLIMEEINLICFFDRDIIAF